MSSGGIKLSHVSVTARDARLLSEFYGDVFGYVERRPPTRLSGDKVSRGNGLPGSDIVSVWLELPGEHGPFLEILEYRQGADRRMSEVNEPGYGHLAFEVPDLMATVARVLECGGQLQGKTTNFGTETEPHLIVYVRDPEGNLLELEQPYRVDDADIE